MKIALLLPVLMAVSCAAPQPELSGLEAQELQARIIETDKRTVFNASVSVLQDAGYVLRNADYETGLITAAGQTKDNTNLFGVLASTSSSVQTTASVFVEPWNRNGTRIRVSFVEAERMSGQYGQSTNSDHTIYSAEVYRNFFNELDKAIFVRSNTGAR